MRRTPVFCVRADGTHVTTSESWLESDFPATSATSLCRRHCKSGGMQICVGTRGRKTQRDCWACQSISRWVGRHWASTRRLRSTREFWSFSRRSGGCPNRVCAVASHPQCRGSMRGTACQQNHPTAHHSLSAHARNSPQMRGMRRILKISRGLLRSARRYQPGDSLYRAIPEIQWSEICESDCMAI